MSFPHELSLARFTNPLKVPIKCGMQTIHLILLQPEYQHKETINNNSISHQYTFDSVAPTNLQTLVIFFTRQTSYWQFQSYWCWKTNQNYRANEERERKCGLNGGGIRNRCPWESLSLVVLVWERHQWGAIEPVSRPSINLNKSSVELRSHRVYLHNCNLLERFWNAWHASDLLFSNFHEWNCFLSEEFCIIVIGSKSNDHYC